MLIEFKNFVSPLILFLTITASAQETMPDPSIGIYPSHNTPYDPASQWCNDVLRILGDAKERASQALAMGDYERAKSALMQGLYRARPSESFGQRPLTSRAIARGIELAQSIQRAVQGEPSEARTNTHFLFRYYDFLFDTAQGLDLPLYLPYFRTRGGCHSCGIDADDIESRFVQYAGEQIRVILTSLAETQGGPVFPLGSPKAFLKALELTTKYAALDLRESLWGTHYACAIRDLEEMSYRLNRFNLGDHSTYRNEFEAVNTSYFEVRRSLDEMNPYRGCEYRSSRRDR